ncbi:MAG: GGDEF domain-containing protein, partial [Proteobacteria bacterium]|nr:GGDEF domain-containing protein [Pseudomonadota bacterium]
RLKELEKLRNQLQEAISKIPDGFALLNHNNEIVLHNDHFIQIYAHYKQLLPYLGNLKGLSLKDFLSLNHEHNPHLIGNFDSKDKATEAKLEMCQSHQSEWHEVNEKGKLIKVNYYKTANDCSILVVRDIAQSVAIEEELTYMAYHDSLTGLSNRKYFIHQLQQTMMSLVSPFKIAVFFIDLDGFKNINDTFGHEMGDWLLIQVAQRLRRCIREGDSIARLGGDEFGVLLNKVEDIPTITHVAQRMLKTIITPYNRQHQTFSIGASIGIAIYPQDGSDVETILNAADNAMYEAKISGKEQFRFASTPVLKEVYFSGL